MKVLDIIINDVLTTDLIYVNINIFTPIYILILQTMIKIMWKTFNYKSLKENKN